MVPQLMGHYGSEKALSRLPTVWLIAGKAGNVMAISHQKGCEIFYDEIVYTIVGQLAAPNSPQWFNTGLHTSYGITGKPQGIIMLTHYRGIK